MLGGWDAVGVLRNWDAQREGCSGERMQEECLGGILRGMLRGWDVEEGLEGGMQERWLE